jgi:hypothetical protein
MAILYIIIVSGASRMLLKIVAWLTIVIYGRNLFVVIVQALVAQWLKYLQS